MQRQEEVDGLLRKATEPNTVAALFLYGQRASGKSTTMLRHIVEETKEGRGPSKVIYLVPTMQELTLSLREWVFGQPVLAEDIERGFPAMNRLSVVTYDEFTAEVFEEEAAGVGYDVTLLVDVRTMPGVEDEVFFGALVKYLEEALMAGRDGGAEVHVALLMTSGRLSARTVNLVKAVTPVAQARIDSMGPQITPEFGAASMEAMTAEVEGNGGLVVHIGDLQEDVPDSLELREPEDMSGDTAIIGITARRYTGRLRIEGREVTMFVSSGKTSAEVLDPVIGQLVHTRRSITHCEMAEETAWIYKASSNPGTLRFLTYYGSEEMHSWAQGSEALGPAWNGDRMLLVLTIMYRWPGVSMREVPMRQPANLRTWTDAFRRLTVLGCIINQNPNDPDGIATLTSRGLEMRRLLAFGYRWSSAWLLVSAMNKKSLDSSTCRVLVAMAFVMQSGQGGGSFAAKIGQTNTADMYSACAPVIKSRASHGYVWLATGVWLEMMANKRFSADVPYMDIGAWMRVGMNAGMDIQDRVINFFTDNPSLPDWAKENWVCQPLSEDQLAFIDEELAWAYLHNVVYIDGTSEPLPSLEVPAHDMVSMAQAIIERREEFMSIETWRARRNESTKTGGFFAIYKELEKRENNQYVARLLTRLPPRVFQRVEEITGRPWPAVVMRAYS